MQFGRDHYLLASTGFKLAEKERDGARAQALSSSSTYPASTPAGSYFIVWDNNGAPEIIGEFIVTQENTGTLVVSQGWLELKAA
jgi:hypothetical protein